MMILMDGAEEGGAKNRRPLWWPGAAHAPCGPAPWFAVLCGEGRPRRIKDADLLRRFINEEGKIRRAARPMCAPSTSVVWRWRSSAPRHLALLPYTGLHEQESRA
jgi:hypothetical protein